MALVFGCIQPVSYERKLSTRPELLGIGGSMMCISLLLFAHAFSKPERRRSEEPSVVIHSVENDVEMTSTHTVHTILQP